MSLLNNITGLLGSTGAEDRRCHDEDLPTSLLVMLDGRGARPIYRRAPLAGGLR